MSAISPTSLSLISNADVRNRVSVAVARKSLDVAESQGEAMVDMIRAAGDVGKSALRIAAQAPGAERGAISARPTQGETGRRLDVTG